MKTSAEITQIDEMLLRLPEKRIHEVRDYVGYLLEKERRHNAFVARALKSEQDHDTVTCNSPEEFMRAIENAEDDDDQA